MATSSVVGKPYWTDLSHVLLHISCRFCLQQKSENSGDNSDCLLFLSRFSFLLMCFFFISYLFYLQHFIHFRIGNRFKRGGGNQEGNQNNNQKHNNNMGNKGPNNRLVCFVHTYSFYNNCDILFCFSFVSAC